MTIVIDSNIWISALVFGGRPRLIFEEVVRSGWRVATSEEIYTEVRRILQKKFPGFTQDFEDLLVVLQPHITLVKLGSQQISVSRDKDDDMVIETAQIGAAHFIITGDKDLLVLKEYEDTVIVTPQQFLDRGKII